MVIYFVPCRAVTGSLPYILAVVADSCGVLLLMICMASS